MLRVLSVLAALFLGLFGLALSLCGGGFLLNGLASFELNWALALLALGSLVVGVLLLWAASRLLQKGTKPPGAED